MFGQLMLHQTLTISSSSAPYSSPLRSALRSPSTNSYCSQVEETGMEALNSCLRLESVPGQQQQAGGVLEEEMVWAVEDGSLLLGEEFSVDDLLNFELVENEKDAEEEEEEEGADGEVGVHKQTEGSNAKPCSASSASSSSLSFDLPPALFGLSLPAHDAEEFEWVSLIMDDSLSEFPSCSGAAPLPLAPQRQDEAGSQPESCTTKGPSFVSPSVCILSTEATVPVKAKRSKRPRSAAAAPWSMSGPLPFAESSSDSTITTTTTSSSSSLVSSCSTPATSSYLIHDSLSAAGEQSFLLCDMPPPLAAKRPKQKPKKRGRKPKPASSSSPTAPGERRCSHCGAQKTPQWRAGPLGAKTLCNACGVRFKSGRLLPEYRPVCSPTFVSHIHSNCHRKVLEMRRKKESELPSAAAPPVPSF